MLDRPPGAEESLLAIAVSPFLKHLLTSELRGEGDPIKLSGLQLLINASGSPLPGIFILTKCKSYAYLTVELQSV